METTPGPVEREVYSILFSSRAFISLFVVATAIGSSSRVVNPSDFGDNRGVPSLPIYLFLYYPYFAEWARSGACLCPSLLRGSTGRLFPTIAVRWAREIRC